MHGKRFVVTGGGTGIGLAVARHLAGSGARMVLVGRKAERLEAAVGELAGEGHAIAPADVSQRGALAAALATAIGDAPIDGVVANAGVGGPNAYGEKDRWDVILRVNLTGTYQTVHECLPRLRARDPESYGHVVIVSSVLAHLGVPGYQAYCASKAGLLGLTRAMAAEYASERILVNAICPGWVDTDMASEGIEGFAKATRTTPEEARRQQMAMVPLGKMATPDELGALVAFLVSGVQTSITGATLDVNNGSLMPG